MTFARFARPRNVGDAGSQRTSPSAQYHLVSSLGEPCGGKGVSFRIGFGFGLGKAVSRWTPCSMVS
jgi:hypothetical protein